MSYKTVLVHVDESVPSDERVRSAAAIALIGGGHLVGAAMTGVSRTLYQHAPVDDDDPNLALHMNFLRDRAARALGGFEQQVSALGLTSFEEGVLDDEAGGGISLLARYADLVVIGQYDPGQQPATVMSDFPAYVVMHSGRPVLIMPHSPSAAGVTPATPRSVVISWNGGKEASRAVTAALPLLKRAGKVLIAVFDPDPETLAAGEEPGVSLATYLARHGVKAAISVRHSERHGSFKRPGDIGEALLALGAEHGADLLIMGAYGHSRFRETILGGVTRTVLQHMTIPVLMAH